MSQTEKEVVVKIVSDIRGLLTGMSESTSVVKSTTSQMQNSLNNLTNAAKTVTGALVGMASIGAVGLFFRSTIKEVVDTAESLSILSRQTGIAAEELSRLQYAAKLSDVEVESFNSSLIKLSRSMAEAAEGGNVADTFKRLGVQVKDSNDNLLPMRDVLLQVADRFQSMKDGAAKSAISMELFGKSGAAMIPVLNQGSAAIKEIEREADRLGITMDGKTIAAANAYDDAMDKLTFTMRGAKREIISGLLPALTSLANAMSDQGAKDSGLTKSMEFIGNVFRGIVSEGIVVVATLTTIKELMSTQDKSLSNALLILKTNATAAKDSIIDLFTDVQDAQDKLKPTKQTIDPKIKEKEKPIDIMQQYQHELDKIKLANASDLDGMTERELRFWEDKLHIAKEGSDEYIAIFGKVTDLTIRMEEDQARAYKKAIDDVKKATEDLAHAQKEYSEAVAEQWMNVFESIPDAFNETFNSMKQTGGTFGDFMRQMFQRLVKDFAISQARMLAASAARWLSEKKITAEGVIQKIAIESWGAIKTIAMRAAEAAAGAWAALSGIPYVGPFLAPAAAAAALAGVLALGGGIRSAAGGYDIPAGLNPITQLHAQEMVLPKEYANVIRGMAEGDGSGGPVNVHIHTIDAAGVNQFLMKHKSAVAAAAYSAADQGMGIRNQPGRRV